MRYVCADVPLEDMPALAGSDLKYAIVSYLECRQCERTWFWGLCIRGAPIFKPVDADDPASIRRTTFRRESCGRSLRREDLDVANVVDVDRSLSPARLPMPTAGSLWCASARAPG